MRPAILLSMFLLPLAAPSARAVPVYQSSQTRTLATQPQDLLQSCKKIDFMYKDCEWSRSYSIVPQDSIEVPLAFRNSPLTALLVDGRFVKSFGDFHLLIGDVAYPLEDLDGVQVFPLPQGQESRLRVTLESEFSGRQLAESDMTALLRSIQLRLDNTALIDSVLQSIGTQAERVQWALDSYRREKKFLRFLSQTDTEIGQIKENLTGRAAKDLSNDCEKPDRLAPDECAYLVSFNRYLAGDHSEFSEETKQRALQKLQTETQTLGEQITFLKQAQKDIRARMLATYQEAFDLLTSEQRAP